MVGMDLQKTKEGFNFMEKDQIRLECLKLACTKSASQQEILAKAADYEKFVVSGAETKKEPILNGNSKP